MPRAALAALIWGVSRADAICARMLMPQFSHPAATCENPRDLSLAAWLWNGAILRHSSAISGVLAPAHPPPGTRTAGPNQRLHTCASPTLSASAPARFPRHAAATAPIHACMGASLGLAWAAARHCGHFWGASNFIASVAGITRAHP